MRYMRCKCGHRTSWTSMGVPRCLACPKCGSDLAESPSDHRDPLPHEYSAEVEQMGVEGPVKIAVCRYCHRPRWEIERESTPTGGNDGD